MANFPTSVSAFATKNPGDVIPSADWNTITGEITAIEDGYVNGTARLNSSKSTLATLSVLGNSTLASTITLGTVAYQFPASAPGSSGQLLICTSTGAVNVLAWQTPGTVSVLDRSVSGSSAATKSSAETTVYSFSVPGNTLSSNRSIRLSLIGDHLNNSGGTDNRVVKVKYGATTIFQATATNVNASANRGALELDVELAAAGATNAQRAKGRWLIGATGDNNAGGVAVTKDFTGGAGGGLTASGGIEQTAVQNNVAEDATAAKTLAVTFQMTVANANSDMRV